LKNKSHPRQRQQQQEIMIQVFTEEECDTIINNHTRVESNDEIKDKLINLMKKYLLDNNLELLNNSKLQIFSSSSSYTNKAISKWHIDHVSVITFIVCVNGEGTYIYDDDNDNNKIIIQLKRGYGYFVIGEMGFAFVGLEPTIHKAPETQSHDRLLFRVVLDGNYDITDYLIGNTEKYNSKLFKKRLDMVHSFVQD